MAGDGTGNGANTDRQVRATAAYAEILAAVATLSDRLFGTVDDPGPIPSTRADLNLLKANPMIRFGEFLASAQGVVAFTLTALAGTATIAAGAIVVLHQLRVI